MPKFPVYIFVSPTDASNRLSISEEEQDKRILAHVDALDEDHAMDIALDCVYVGTPPAENEQPLPSQKAAAESAK